MIDWHRFYAGVWRAKKGYLKPIEYLDEINLTQLVGIEPQQNMLTANTQRFIAKKPCNNVLLWGARGCGKSSLVKAVFNHYKQQKLRLIEIERDDLLDLLDIVDEIRNIPYRFIIFCDDLVFADGDNHYRGLKRVLEGSIEAKPDNIVIYATSNRKHLLPEFIQDNHDIHLKDDGEIHFSDSVEERISLSDRFGLNISFYTGTKQDYLKMVDHYFDDFTGNKELLHKEAMAFATKKGIKNGRTAKQFYNYFYT